MPAAVNFARDSNAFLKKPAWAWKRKGTFIFSYSSHLAPHQSWPWQHQPPPPPPPFQSINQPINPMRSLCPFPMLPLETSTPAQGFPCHLLTLLNYLFTTPFIWAGIIHASSVFSIVFFWSSLSLGIIFILFNVLSNQLHYSLWFALYSSDSFTKSTALWQWQLFPDSSGCEAVFFNWWVACRRGSCFNRFLKGF